MTHAKVHCSLQTASDVRGDIYELILKCLRCSRVDTHSFLHVLMPRQLINVVLH